MPLWKMESNSLIIKWLHGILTKPIAILKSIYYRIKCVNQNISIKRLKICNKCNYRVSSKFGDICSSCGCILANKTRLEEERCDLNKW